MKNHFLINLQIISLLFLLPHFSYELYAQITPLDGRGGGILSFTSDRDGNSEVYAMNADGSGQRNITNNPASDGFGVWSPDGMKVAFVSDRDSQFGIYVMNVTNILDGEFDLPIKIANKRPTSRVAWFPDGSKLIFDAWPDCDIYTVNSDGSNLTRLTNTPEWEFQPHISPDGLQIIYCLTQNNQQNIYLMGINGSNNHAITQDGVSYFPIWSPDGNRIAFNSTRPGRQDVDICLIDPDGTNRIWLTSYSGHDEFPTWSPDGDSIAYQSDRGVHKIFIMSSDGSNDNQVTNNTSYNNGEPIWRPSTNSTGLKNKNESLNSHPQKFHLNQNYPNPFNPVTIIKYQIPYLCFVTIKVYDVLGNEIITLINEEEPVGSYEVEFDGSGLTSGIYYYTVKAGYFSETKKMCLTK